MPSDQPARKLSGDKLPKFVEWQYPLLHQLNPQLLPPGAAVILAGAREDRRRGEGRMEVLDFDGACRVERDDELLARLRSVRRGADGAFILDHGGVGRSGFT